MIMVQEYQVAKRGVATQYPPALLIGYIDSSYDNLYNCGDTPVASPQPDFAEGATLFFVDITQTHFVELVLGKFVNLGFDQPCYELQSQIAAYYSKSQNKTRIVLTAGCVSSDEGNVTYRMASGTVEGASACS
jgi:hypothetical protein